MSLASVIPDPSLERKDYHLLSQEELDTLEDAEALFERGRRLKNGICVNVDEKLSWEYIIASARQGHPVALAYCYDFGRELNKDLQRSVQIIRGSAERNHPAGSACKHVQAFVD
jgi:TPR repeat protein